MAGLDLGVASERKGFPRLESEGESELLGGMYGGTTYDGIVDAFEPVFITGKVRDPERREL